MKKLTFLVIITLNSMTLFAQVFPVETIFKNGEPDKRINFVFLSDGYKADELDKYIVDVNKILSDIFTQSPFKEYKNYFNVYAIKVPSQQSGANHPKTTSDSDCAVVPEAVVNNYFGSSFDTGGIHRLLVPKKNVAAVLAANFPAYDQAFVLVNSSYYGGSGGGYSSSSTHPASSEVSFHEIGHSFAGLADEYWAGAIYEAEKPNMTKESNVDKIKWKGWLGNNGIGIYPHQESPSWFRPHQNCKMRILNSPFCNVCRESFLEQIHTLVSSVNGYTPLASNFKPNESGIDFSLDLIKSIPNTLKIEWRRNATVFAKNLDKVTVPLSQLSDEANIIEAEITDTTSLIRTKTHFSTHVYTVTWKVTKTSSGVEIVPTIVIGKTIIDSPITGLNEPTDIHNDLNVYPNPFFDQLNLSYTLIRNTSIAMAITDAEGRVVKEVGKSQQRAGKYDYTFSISELNLNSQGVYFFTLKMDGVTVVKKIIKQ